LKDLSEMDKTLAAITHLVYTNYPHLLDNNTSITDYCFWDPNTNKEVPIKDLDAVNRYKIINNISEILLVIYFSDNTIGYRLKL